MHGDEHLMLQFRELVDQLQAEEPALAQEIALIIWGNWDTSRIKTVLKNHAELDAAGYFQRVLNCYAEWHELVQLLQSGEELTWIPFYILLQKWAYRLLERWHVAGRQREVILDHAQACATETAIVLLKKPYPYDVHYYRWAYQVLRFTSLRHVARETKTGKDRDGGELVELDEELHALSAQSETRDSRHVERRLDLLDAINSLASESRKQFIILFYFEGKTLAEIAVITDRNINAVYKLHYDALTDLRNQFR